MNHSFKKGISFKSKLWLILVFQSVAVLFTFVTTNMLYFQDEFQDIGEKVDNAFYFFAALTFGMILLIGLSTYLFEKYLTAPVRAFMSSIQSYHETGYATQVNIQSNDEFEKLAFAFNKMIDSSRLSLIDPMTNVFNRRFFDAELCRLIESAKEKNDDQMAIAIFDIDFFKKINDVHGHAIGDEAIKFFADILKNQFRTTDIIARFGGEEFVVILQRSDLDKSFEVCERVRKYVEQQSFVSAVNKKTIQFTVSCGLANVVQANYNAATFFDLADQALLTSKQTGRNRVTISETESIIKLKAA